MTSVMATRSDADERKEAIRRKLADAKAAKLKLSATPVADDDEVGVACLFACFYYGQLGALARRSSPAYRTHRGVDSISRCDITLTDNTTAGVARFAHGFASRLHAGRSRLSGKLRERRCTRRDGVRGQRAGWVQLSFSFSEAHRPRRSAAREAKRAARPAPPKTRCLGNASPLARARHPMPCARPRVCLLH